MYLPKMDAILSKLEELSMVNVLLSYWPSRLRIRWVAKRNSFDEIRCVGSVAKHDKAVVTTFLASFNS